MLKNEWDEAVKAVTTSLGPRTGWKSLYLAMTDEGGHAAAQVLYQGSKMDRVLTAKTSRERHHQLAEWVIHGNTGRFARIRARAWRRIMNERLREMEAAARGGNLYPV